MSQAFDGIFDFLPRHAHGGYYPRCAEADASRIRRVTYAVDRRCRPADPEKPLLLRMPNGRATRKEGIGAQDGEIAFSGLARPLGECKLGGYRKRGLLHARRLEGPGHPALPARAMAEGSMTMHQRLIAGARASMRRISMRNAEAGIVKRPQGLTNRTATPASFIRPSRPPYAGVTNRSGASRTTLPLLSRTPLQGIS